MPKEYTKKNSSKQVIRATGRLIKESQRQARQDLVKQWQFLRRIGAYDTKETAAQIRLTDSRIKAIKKKMKEISGMKVYRGRKVLSPVELISYSTPKGKRKIKYDLRPSFALVKTKHKPNAIEGIKKVGRKSYIVETTSYGSKLSINKKGDIVETRGKTRRIRKRMRGRDMMNYLSKLESGKIKAGKHDLIVFHTWGSPTRGIQQSSAASVGQLLNYINEKKITMDQKTFDSFVSQSYIEIIKQVDD